MTEKQKRVLRGLMAGRSYTEIAQEMGITRESAYSLAKRAIAHGGNYTKGFYPNIRNYIAENCVNIADFAKGVGVSYTLVQQMLKYGRTPNWTTIKKMTEYTGMDIKTLMVRETDNVQA